MKKSRFTETQIVSILNEADAGVKVQDLCRKVSGGRKGSVCSTCLWSCRSVEIGLVQSTAGSDGSRR
ncbi:MAG: hypothetical protein GY835_25200 [bacterium]|nr:hypothetical protein [bacterium]